MWRLINNSIKNSLFSIVNLRQIVKVYLKYLYDISTDIRIHRYKWLDPFYVDLENINIKGEILQINDKINVPTIPRCQS